MFTWGWHAPGQNLLEYGLLLVTVALGVLLAGGLFGEVLRLWLGRLVDTVTSH